MPRSTARPTLSRRAFGTRADGAAVERYDLRAGSLEMAVMTHGATILSLRAPDARGVAGDVVLGFDTVAEYERWSPYFGAVVGRCANRIAHGRFALDGTTWQLATNDGANHLHGGVRGFDRLLWAATTIEREDAVGVAFACTSADGDEGYPGTLVAQVEYLLTLRNELRIRYRATTSRPTVVNLTQHSYFDLTAARAPDVGGHLLTIHADAITPVDDGLIPTGAFMPVEDTPFDFRRPATIGARVDDAHEQLRVAGGYDHNFVLRRSPDDAALSHAARVSDPVSGRTLDVHTTEPGLQFYSGNFLDGSLRGSLGRVFGHRSGFCLETQHFPDSPNQPAFPSVTLRPGELWQSETVFAFGTTAR